MRARCRPRGALPSPCADTPVRGCPLACLPWPPSVCSPPRRSPGVARPGGRGRRHRLAAPINSAGSPAAAEVERRADTAAAGVYADTRAGMLSPAVEGHRERIYVPNSRQAEGHLAGRIAVDLLQEFVQHRYRRSRDRNEPVSRTRKVTRTTSPSKTSPHRQVHRSWAAVEVEYVRGHDSRVQRHGPLHRSCRPSLRVRQWMHDAHDP